MVLLFGNFLLQVHCNSLYQDILYPIVEITLKSYIITIFYCFDDISSCKPQTNAALSTTITICCCSINHHKPTTLCFHGNIFEYVVAWSFTYTLVSAQFLRKVPIKRDLHISTATHKFVVIYSLSWMHCAIMIQ